MFRICKFVLIYFVFSVYADDHDYTFDLAAATENNEGLLRSLLFL